MCPHAFQRQYHIYIFINSWIDVSHISFTYFSLKKTKIFYYINKKQTSNGKYYKFSKEWNLDSIDNGINKWHKFFPSLYFLREKKKWTKLEKLEISSNIILTVKDFKSIKQVLIWSPFLYKIYFSRVSFFFGLIFIEIE